MTKKRTHKNWRYAIYRKTRPSWERDFIVYSENWYEITYKPENMDFVPTEKHLLELWFVPEKDKYESCAKEILEFYNSLHEKHHILVNFMWQVDIEPILRKHFPEQD